MSKDKKSEAATVVAEEETEGLELVPVEEETNLPTLEGASQGGNLMSSIIKLSEMPNLDMDRVDKLFEMHNQMLDREAEQQFNDAMARAQRDIQNIVVNKVNTHTDSGYADLGALHKGAKPIWTQFGFSIVSRTSPSQIDNHIHVRTEVRHAAGHKEVYEDDWPMDLAGIGGKVNKTAIQAKGSTITYARRYTELMIFDVAVQGEDNDGNSSQELSDLAEKWIGKILNSQDMVELEANYLDGYQALNGDQFGQKQVIQAKNTVGKRLRGTA